MSLSYMGSSHSGCRLSHYCKRALREIFGSWWVHLSVCTKVHVSMSTAPPLCDMAPYSEINRENKNSKSVLKLASPVREEGCFPQLVSGSGFYTETETESVKQQKQLAPECLSILGNPEHVRVSWYHPCWTSSPRGNMEGMHRELPLCLCTVPPLKAQAVHWCDPGWPWLFS